MKFENTEIFNFEGSFRGLRNPLESWDKSDSIVLNDRQYNNFRIGKNDLNLAQRMLKAGTDNSKFMRQIIVSTDITAPLYWWKEYDTYKVGTVANSTSTMHKLASTPITKECFEILPDFEIEDEGIRISDCWINIITDCEMLRQKYLKTKDKRYWKALIQLLPDAWLQKRTCTLSYANLRAMYFARRNHKLTEWSTDFINWFESLPYSKELIMFE